MVNCTIDHIPVTVPANTTIMQAAESVGIAIPHLCFLKDLNGIAACRVCVKRSESRWFADVRPFV